MLLLLLGLHCLIKNCKNINILCLWIIYEKQIRHTQEESQGILQFPTQNPWKAIFIFPQTSAKSAHVFFSLFLTVHRNTAISHFQHLITALLPKNTDSSLISFYSVLIIKKKQPLIHSDTFLVKAYLPGLFTHFSLKRSNSSDTDINLRLFHVFNTHKKYRHGICPAPNMNKHASADCRSWVKTAHWCTK